VKSIMEGKAAVPSDEEFKSTGMEEGNTAWKQKGIIFLDREKSQWWLELLESLDNFISKLIFSNTMIKLFLKIPL
jgi:hypothetical protein